MVYHTAAEGNGPVAALDAALRKALVDTYPIVSRFQLVDYKVRILDSDTGTSATTRVLIDTRLESPDRAAERWSTVGASGNIIEASWQALKDAYDYGLAALASDGNGSGMGTPTRSRRSKYRPRSPDFLLLQSS